MKLKSFKELFEMSPFTYEIRKNLDSLGDMPKQTLDTKGYSFLGKVLK